MRAILGLCLAAAPAATGLRHRPHSLWSAHRPHADEEASGLDGEPVPTQRRRTLTNITSNKVAVPRGFGSRPRCLYRGGGGAGTDDVALWLDTTKNARALTRGSSDRPREPQVICQ